MGIELRRTDRRTRDARSSGWTSRLLAVACLGGWVLAVPPVAHGQAVPANLPSALDRLRAIVGVEPTPPPPPRSEPPHRDTARVRLITAPKPVAAKTSGRLEFKRRLGDLLALLDRLTPNSPSPLLPVSHSLPAGDRIPERRATTAGLEMPHLEPVPGEGVTAHRVTAGRKPAASRGPARPGSWGMVGGIVCLMLIGTTFLAALVFGSRWLGLAVRFQFSLGVAAPHRPA